MKETMTIPRLSNDSDLAELFEAREPRRSLETVLGSLVTSEGRKLTDLAPALQSTLALPRPAKKTLSRLSLLSKPQTLTLDEVEGTLTNFRRTLDIQRVGTITLTLPFGLGNYYVNAATFKALAGRQEDTLLRKAGRRWEIVEDDELIDLGDRTQLFKLGQIQIYS